jgi:hypothetical protein
MALSFQAQASPRQFYQGQPVAPITSPTAVPTLAVSGSGGGLTAGTYYVAYSWLNTNYAAGYQETVFSPIASITITVGQTITVTLPALDTNAATANIYIGSATGQANMHLQGTSSTTTFAQSAALNTTSTLSSTTNATVSGQWLYSAPALDGNVTSPSSTAYITEIFVTNTTSAPVTLTLCMVPYGGVQGTANALIYNMNIPTNANGPVDFGQLKTYMPAQSFLSASQGTAGAITLTISGAEVQ